MSESSTGDSVHCFCTQNTAGEICCCKCRITQTHSAMIQAADIIREIHDQIEVESFVCERIMEKRDEQFKADYAKLLKGEK